MGLVNCPIAEQGRRSWEPRRMNIVALKAAIVIERAKMREKAVERDLRGDRARNGARQSVGPKTVSKRRECRSIYFSRSLKSRSSATGPGHVRVGRYT